MMEYHRLYLAISISNGFRITCRTDLFLILKGLIFGGTTPGTEIYTAYTVISSGFEESRQPILIILCANCMVNY